MPGASKIAFRLLLAGFVVFCIAFGTPVLSMFLAGKVVTWAGCVPAGFDMPDVRCPGRASLLADRFGPFTYWFTTLLSPYYLVKQFWDVLAGWSVLLLVFGVLSAERRAD